MQGNILLHGHSLLLQNHSILMIQEPYSYAYTVSLADGAKWSLNGSIARPSGWGGGLSLDGRANVTAQGSTLNDFTINLFGNASMFLQSTQFFSEIDFPDFPGKIDYARFYAINVCCFGVYLDLRSGTVANVTLPGPGPTPMWDFPGGGSVVGIHYSVRVVACGLNLVGVFLQQGSQETFVNSPGVVIAFVNIGGTAVFRDLNQTYYGSLRYLDDGYDLTLYDTTVRTWSLYPSSGSIYVYDSSMGEIQVTGSGSAVVHSSNLTGLTGGFGADWYGGRLSMYDSTIATEVQAINGGEVLLENCSVSYLRGLPTSVLAAAGGTIWSVDSWLEGGASYGAQQTGRIVVEDSLHLNATLGGGPTAAPGGAMLNWTANGTALSSGSLNPTGGWTRTVPSRTLTAAGWAFTDNYTATAWAEDAEGSVQVRLDRPTWQDVPLGPLVTSVSPANGSTSVAPDATLLIDFRLPMVPLVPSSMVTLSPSTAFSGGWNSSDTLLTLVPASALSYNKTNLVSVSTSTTVRGGVPFTVPYEFSFRVLSPPPPPPLVLTASASPASGTSPLFVRFTGSVSGGVPPFTVEWRFGDGGGGTLLNTTHTFVRPGTYEAALWVNDSAGHTSTSSIMIVVSEAASVPPAPPGRSPPTLELFLIAVGLAAILSSFLIVLLRGRGKRARVGKGAAHRAPEDRTRDGGRKGPAPGSVSSDGAPNEDAPDGGDLPTSSGQARAAMTSNG